ncbi:MAG: hypothetical protein HYT73_04805 [Candidatus Aenigmarchaeota archaeon]|nr:hypothetical protein [Candidatus Aenigmarchaeota archaeon]
MPIDKDGEKIEGHKRFLEKAYEVMSENPNKNYSVDPNRKQIFTDEEKKEWLSNRNKDLKLGIFLGILMGMGISGIYGIIKSIAFGGTIEEMVFDLVFAVLLVAFYKLYKMTLKGDFDFI